MPYRNPTSSFYKKKTAPKSRLNRRWFFDATLPKTAFTSGGGFRMGDGSLNKRSLMAAVKAETRNLEVTKYKAIPLSTQPLLAGTWYTLNPLGNITIGTGETNRVGTDIFVRKIKLKLVAHNNVALIGALAGATVHFRMLWIRSAVPVGSGLDIFGPSGLGNSDLVQQGNTYPLTSIIDKDKCSVLSDTVFTIPQSNISASNNSKYVEFDCPVQDFPFRYSSATSNFSNVNKNVYCLITPQIVGDSTGTTQDMHIVYQWSTEFADSR